MAEFQHINAKIFAHEGSTIDWHVLIPIFHRWIQQQALPDLLIDVADYAHVPAGPGVMIIGHDAQYSLDNRQNRLGFVYDRRTACEGSNADRIRLAYESALSAARRLEQEPEINGALRFDERRVEFWVNDRLLAPNKPEVFEEFESEVSAFLKSKVGEFALSRSTDPRDLVRVRT